MMEYEELRGSHIRAIDNRDRINEVLEHLKGPGPQKISSDIASKTIYFDLDVIERALVAQVCAEDTIISRYGGKLKQIEDILND